jgi:glycerol kinase
MGVGFWNGTEELSHARIVDRVFAPEMPGEERKRLYDGWKAAVARARSR